MNVVALLKLPVAKDWRIDWKTPWSSLVSLLLLKLIMEPVA